MKKLKSFGAMFIIAMLLWGGGLLAQDGGTYIENSSPQDSSYSQEADLDLNGSKDAKGGSNAAVIGGVVAAVVVAGVFLLRKKKKK
jgi:LPXTG-motif cell wall-anchored protein